MRALVLGPGGSRGAFQVGVLAGLLEEDPTLDYDIYWGVSVGALTASALAQGPLRETLPGVEKVWLKDITSRKNVWQHRLAYRLLGWTAATVLLFLGAFGCFLGEGPKLFTMILAGLGWLSLFASFRSLARAPSVYRVDPLQTVIEDQVDGSKVKAAGKKLRIGAISVETGRFRTVSEEQKDLSRWVLASASFPVFFPPVRIDGETWIDGGMGALTPLWDAISLGATHIDVIATICRETDEDPAPVGILGSVARVVDLGTTGVWNDLERLAERNPHVQVRFFYPTPPFPRHTLKFEPLLLWEMYCRGKESVRKVDIGRPSGTIPRH